MSMLRWLHPVAANWHRHRPHPPPSPAPACLIETRAFFLTGWRSPSLAHDPELLSIHCHIQGCANTLLNLASDPGNEKAIAGCGAVSVLLITALVASDSDETRHACTKAITNLLCEEEVSVGWRVGGGRNPSRMHPALGSNSVHRGLLYVVFVPFAHPRLGECLTRLPSWELLRHVSAPIDMP